MGAFLSRLFSLFGMRRLTPIANENETYPVAPLSDISEIESENDIAETTRQESKDSKTSVREDRNVEDVEQENEESNQAAQDATAGEKQVTPKGSDTRTNLCSQPSDHCLADNAEKTSESEEPVVPISSRPSKGSVFSENLAEISTADNEDTLKEGQYTRNIRWEGNASSVSITGNWLNWSDMIPLRPDGEFSVWEADVIFPGHLELIELKFIVDGDWVTSSGMPVVTNDVGSQNNVVYLNTTSTET